MAKDKFDSCLSKKLDNESIKIVATRQFDNTLNGFKQFTAWLKTKTKDLPISQIVLEPTGVYHENLAYFLNDKGYNVCIVMGKFAKHFIRSLGLKSKTDKIDAKGLAQMACERKIKAWKAPVESVRKLKSLFRYKEALIKNKTQISNRLHAMENSFSPDRFVIKELKTQLKHNASLNTKLKTEIEKRLKEENEFNKKVHKIADSLKGVGAQTVAMIAAELSGFSNFTSQSQVVSYCGYDIRLNQSGQFSGKEKISKQGNSRIRKALFYPSFSAVMHGEEKGVFKSLFDRVYDRTKIKMKGYVAVQRKMLTIIFALWKNDTTFDINYKNKYELSMK